MSKETRNRIRALVVQFPGLHLREIARQLDMSLALVQYHLPHLVESGAVEVSDEDGTQRVFATKHHLDRKAVACIRDPRRLQICLILLENGPLRHGDIIAFTKLGKSTLSFHLKRLESAGLVQRNEQAYELADAVATRHLIDKHRPTPDVIDKFARMWGDLYG